MNSTIKNDIKFATTLNGLIQLLNSYDPHESGEFVSIEDYGISLSSLPVFSNNRFNTNDIYSFDDTHVMVYHNGLFVTEPYTLRSGDSNKLVFEYI